MGPIVTGTSFEAASPARSRWTRFLLALALLNLSIAGLYLALGRSWVALREANSRVTLPFDRRIVIEGRDFVSVTDAQLLSILTWEAVLVGALVLLRHAARGKARGPSREVALLGATLLALLWVAEVCVRVYHKRSKDLPYLLPLNVFYDPVLGWKGKKAFGDPRSPRPKLLVIGDSFTDGLGVPERAMYYAYLMPGQYPELFVYGGAGYGTLQELMVLERHLDAIDPRLVLLQVCTNDFKNNSYAIQSASYGGNNFLARPFLEDGEVRYRAPSFLGGLRPGMADTSRLAYELFIGAYRAQDHLRRKGWLPCVECRIIEGQERETFAASVRTTGALLDRFRARLGRRRFAAFTADLAEPFLAELRRLFHERGIPFLEEPARAVASAEARGARLRLADGHWNEEGHRIIGDSLAEALSRLGSLPD